MKSSEEEKDSAAAGASTRLSPPQWPRAHPQYEEATEFDPEDSDGDDDQTHESYPRDNYEDEELAEEFNKYAEEFKKYAKGRDHQLEDFLKQFSIRPEMRAMFKSLSTIYRDNPDKCPYEIRLIVLTYEFIEFILNLESTDTESLEDFIEFLRKRWGNVGPFVNREYSCRHCFSTRLLDLTL